MSTNTQTTEPKNKGGRQPWADIPVPFRPPSLKAAKTRKADRMRYPTSLYGLVDLWIQERSPKPPSIRMMEDAIKSFIDATAVDNLHNLLRAHILKWKKVLLDERKVAPATYNTYLRHLKVLLRLAVIWGWDSGNILYDIRQVPILKTRSRAMDDRDIQEVMRYVDDPKNRQVFPGWFWATVIRVLYYTGVRRRQLVGLTWGDIDLKTMTIHLRAHHSKTGREWEIPLPSQLLEPLAQLQRRTEEHLRRSVRLEDQLLNVTLWNNRYKTNKQQADVMTVDHLSSGLRRIRDLTGFEISAHKFRHTFATNLANKGGNVKELQAILGHTNLSTTMGYVTAKMDTMRDMMEGLGNEI